MARWSLKTRVAGMGALLTLALAGTLALVLPARLGRVSMAWAESRALTVARVVATSCSPAAAAGDAARARVVLAQLGGPSGALGAALLRPDGAPLATWGLRPEGPLAAPGAEAVLGSLERIRVRVPVPMAGAAGALVLDVEPSELRARLREVRRVLSAGLLAAVVLGLVGAGLIGAVTARPLQHMTAVARRIAQGDLSARADLERRGGAEAHALADALDAMLQRLYGQQALLAERARAIGALNAELEARVDERTAELEAANRALAERLDELHRTQEQLILADRRVAVGRLAAGVAHEINNPLACVGSNLRAVAGALEGLLRELPPAARPDARAEVEDARAALADALECASRVTRIVRSLRAFSRDDEDGREPVLVDDAIGTAVAVAGHELRLRARLELDLHPTPRVLASPVRLSQVFLNLLVNAAQAIPEGAPDRHRIRVSTGATADGRVRVELSDTGAGIAPDHLGRIFDPFFTTRAVGAGTGLGLSVTQGIVAALGGSISCASAPGEGTTFTILLPAADARAAPPRPAPRARA